jgi:O-antigen ligase
MPASDLREPVTPAQKARWTLGAVIVGSGLAAGGVHTPVLLLLSLGLFVTGWLLRDRVQIGRFAWVLLALSAATLLQIVPLPPSLASFLSPHAAEVWTRTNQLLGEQHWVPLSLAPGATLLEALKWADYAAVAALAGTLARQRSPWTVIRLVVLAAASVALATTLLRLVGAETLFGLYRPRFAGQALPIMNPNSLSGYLNLGTFCALALLLRERRPGWLLALGSAAVLCLANTLLLASRGGVATLIIGLLMCAALVARDRIASQRPWRAQAGALALVAALGAVLFALGVGPQTWRELGSQSLFKLDLFARTLTMIAEHPWFGVGRGAFETAFAPYQPRGLYTPNVVFGHPENIVLQYVVEWGIPVALFAAVALVFALRPRFTSSTGVPMRVVVIGVVVLLAQNLFDLGSEIPAVMIALCAVIGALFCNEYAAQSWPTSTERAGRWGLMAGQLALMGAVAWSWPARAVEVRDELYGNRVTIVRGNQDLFVELLNAGLRQYPGDAYLILFGAYTWHDQDPARALRFANWALERDENHGPAHLFVAEQLLARGAGNQAMLEVRLAVTSWPSLVPEAAAMIHGWTHDARLIEQAAPEGRLGAELLSLIARQEQGETRERLVQAALQRDPSHGPSQLLIAAPDPDAALKLLREQCPSAVAPAECWRKAVEVANGVSLEAFEESMKTFIANACSSPAECAAAEQWAAERCSNRNDWLSAANHLRRALEQEPSRDRWLRLADAAQRAGLTNEAQHAREQAAK